MVLAGESRGAVLRMFRASGVKTARGGVWYAASLTDLLTRWRNCGWTAHHWRTRSRSGLASDRESG